jgi:hypothetical protein
MLVFFVGVSRRAAKREYPFAVRLAQQPNVTFFWRYFL